MIATQELLDDHEGIREALSLLESLCQEGDAGMPWRWEIVEVVLDFLMTFIGQGHYGKEEEVFFPVLSGSASWQHPVSMILREHEVERVLLGQVNEAFRRLKEEGCLGEFLEKVRNYIGLITIQLQKESLLLFPFADAVISEPIQREVAKRFGEIERRRLGVGWRSRFLDLLKKIAASDEAKWRKEKEFYACRSEEQKLTGGERSPRDGGRYGSAAAR